jgi:FtsZ-interacting cell division protein ZipA
MSSLQLGLIVAGVVLVVAVIVYNVWQERRLKRSLAESTRSPERPAVDASRRSAERVEPTLGAQRAASPTASEDPAFRAAAGRESTFVPPGDVIAAPGASETIEIEPPPAEADAMPVVDASVAAEEEAAPIASTTGRVLPSGGHEARKLPQPDHEIECLIPLSPAAPIGAGALAAGLHARIGKPVRWFGRADARSDWEQLAAETPGRFADAVACMLLADRNGAASRAQLDTFARVVREIASTLGATFTLPDLAHEATRAESLDRLCAELDVQIGLTVQMPEPASIPGTRLRGVAEAAGFRLSPAGRFEFVNEDTGGVLYTLQNLRPDAFSAEMLRLTATNGVVFLLDVARLSDPVRTFDQMKIAAKRMATTLGAELVDDNRRPLDDAALGTIREQVKAAADALRAVHVEPGSQRALALFSA